MTDEQRREQRLGSSGVFKVIVESARAVKRALSENDAVLPPEMTEVGNEIGRCFIANRFADIHAMAAPVLEKHIDADRFVASWREAVKDIVPLTSFDVADAGEIELGFVPSLEELPQSQFAAFLEIRFSNPTQEDALTIGVVLVDDAGQVCIGAIHAR